MALLALTSAGAVVAEQGRPPAVASEGGSYVDGVVGGHRHFLPVLSGTAVDQDVERLVFTGLMRADRAGEIVPDLAANVRVEAGGKVWTFDIRDDARWQDGEAVVADDVIYTVGILQDRAYAGPFAEPLRGVAVERVGPKSVRFTLPGPYGPFTASTTFPLLPAHLLSGTPFARLAAEPFDQRPIGTGPFRVSDVSDKEIVLVANLDFYRTRPARTRPYLDRLILRSYPSTSEALVALARGDLDGVASVSSADAERARPVRSIAVYSYPTNDFAALFLNVRADHPVFRDRAVRQAIATAIDRGKVLDAAIDGRGRVADTFVPPTSWAYPAQLAKRSRSVEDAVALLDGAGWKDSDGDGVRDKGGVSLRFTIVTSDEPARTSAGAQIVSGLKEIGIAAEVRALPFGELVDPVIRQRTFDALLVGVTGGADPDPYPFLHSSQVKDPGANFSGFSTLPLDRLLEGARRVSEREERRALYEPVFQTVATEVPIIFLYFSDHLYAQRATVRGLKIAQITDPSRRFWDVEDWYVRRAAAR